jgi:RNA polymerase sigma-70 factor (ECF subfamily)
MSSIYELPEPVDALAPAAPEAAPAVQARPRLRVVPDVPLDFDAAVRTLTPRLVRYATRRLADAHEAEEVVQEALLRAYKHREELLTEDDLAAWSTCVTGRLVIDRLRVRGRSTSVADVPEGTRVGRDTADVVVARDEARTALDALDAMPPRQAAVLWAREVEGLAYEDIGARFGMTEPAVRSILTRARKALRKEYAARGGTLPAGGLAAIAPWADGLGWLERLRGAMGRLTAPAALSVLGVGVIAGSLLMPATETVTAAPHTQSVTTVTLADSPAPLHVPARTATAAAAAAPAADKAGTARRAPRLNALHGITEPLPCSTVTQEQERELPGLPSSSKLDLNTGAGVGDGDCTPMQRQSSTYLNIELPGHYKTGIKYVGVTLDEACPTLPAQPKQQLVVCSNEQNPADGETR